MLDKRWKTWKGRENWIVINRVGSSEFSAANLVLAGFPLTNALGESMPSRH